MATPNTPADEFFLVYQTYFLVHVGVKIKVINFSLGMWPLPTLTPPPTELQWKAETGLVSVRTPPNEPLRCMCQYCTCTCVLYLVMIVPVLVQLVMIVPVPVHLMIVFVNHDCNGCHPTNPSDVCDTRQHCT